MAGMIEVVNVKKCFGSGETAVWALKEVSALIPEGKLTMLRGPSGSGKTTLLNIMSTLDEPTEGTVLFDGKDLSGLSEAEKTKLRRNSVGFVFQSVALIPIMTAAENVDFALRLSGFKGDRRGRTVECLAEVGLSKRADHLPQELSGGEQQRVAIARAFAPRPRIVFADEPTGALDTSNGIAVVKMFRNLVEKENITVLMTTHDMGLLDLADRVYALEGGEIRLERG